MKAKARDEKLTWRTTGGQVLEVTALDDLRRQTSGGAIVRQSEEQLRRSAVHHGLARRTAVASRQTRQARLRLSVLKHRHTGLHVTHITGAPTFVPFAQTSSIYRPIRVATASV